MPLVTLSNPAVAQPADKPASRPVVFLLANIHGGEVEGKEAVQVLMRRLTSGDLRPLLDRMVIVIAPNYNADGNEAVDVMNRTAQYGPIAGVGSRENAKKLDLNRDYMKLESAEARALAARLHGLGSAPDGRPAHDQRLVSRLSPDAVDPAQPVAQPEDARLPPRDDDAGDHEIARVEPQGRARITTATSAAATPRRASFAAGTRSTGGRAPARTTSASATA